MSKIVWAIIISILFFFFHLLVENFVLSSIAKIQITVEPNITSQVTVYYSKGFAGQPFTEKNSVKSQVFKEGIKTDITLSLRNRVGRNLRIDPLSQKGSIKIYSIKLLSHFGDPILFSPKQIFQKFLHDSATTIILHENYVEISSAGPDPQLILKKNLRFSNSIFSYFLPAFLSVLCTIVLKNFSLKDIYALKDVTHKKPSTNKKIISLDGLRGFAALLVLADHTGWVYFKGLGAIGVWLFFSLSGFLLSIPFVKNPSLIKSSSYLQHYLLRRIKRILPMYYFVLIVAYLFRGRLEDFIRHAVFIQGDGIYWSVPQEMFFYMILPLIFALNFYLCRGNLKVIIIFTLIMAVSLNQWINADFIYIYGNGRRLSLWLGIFLSGVCMSYFYHSPYVTFLQNRSSMLHNIFGIVLLGSICLSSDPFLDYIFNKSVYYTWEYSDIYGYIATLLILFTIINEKSILNKIMSFYPLRAVGIVGFSFYLLHPNVQQMIKVVFFNITGQNINHFALLLMAILLTYFFSVITYSLIERPFLRKAEKIVY